MCNSHEERSGGCHCRGGLLRGFIQPKLLLQLAKNPAHGYELMESLNQTDDIASSDPGNLYRILRGLEENGLVHSTWDTSGTGPARREYTITQEGLIYLEAWAVDLRETRKKLDDFLGEYESQFSFGTQSVSAHHCHCHPGNECTCANTVSGDGTNA